MQAPARTPSGGSSQAVEAAASTKPRRRPRHASLSPMSKAHVKAANKAAYASRSRAAAGKLSTTATKGRGAPVGKAGTSAANLRARAKVAAAQGGASASLEATELLEEAEMADPSSSQ